MQLTTKFTRTMNIDSEVPAGVSLREATAQMEKDYMLDFKAPAGFTLKLTGIVNFEIIPVEEKT